LTEVGISWFLKKIGRCFLATFDVFEVWSGVTDASCWMNVTVVEVRDLNVMGYPLCWEICVRLGMVFCIEGGFKTSVSEGLCM
jgi:hypothetical protein